ETFGDLVARRATITVPLSLAAFALSILVSFPLGTLAAVRRDSPVGLAVSALSQVGVAVPIFWVGVILIWLFALEAGTLPSGGFPRQGWADPLAAGRALVLPAITLAAALSSGLIRYLRSAVLDVLDYGHIRTARALGYSGPHAMARHGCRRPAVLFVLDADDVRTSRSPGFSGPHAMLRHGPRHAARAVVDVVGVELPTPLLGAVVVQNVVALPALGTLLVDSVPARDMLFVQ